MTVDSLASEYLFKDWEEFPRLVYECGNSVDMIVWFEHIPESKQPSSLGYGGYKDLQNTDWIYADTLMCETGLASKTYEEVLEYIKGVMREYSGREMVPAFYLEIERERVTETCGQKPLRR